MFLSLEEETVINTFTKENTNNYEKALFFASLFMFLFTFSVVNAEEAQNNERWKPTAEVIVSVHNGYVDEYSGFNSYKETLVTQSLMFGVDKKGTGLYLQVDNFTPSEGETRETDFYAGFYTEIHGVKIDSGYGRYWIPETGAIDFNGVYTEITLPATVWNIIPFVKAEYRFAEKAEQEDANKISYNGFVYLGGLKREFQIHEKAQLTTEISLGGNTGIYGMTAEHFSFAREKIEFNISLLEQLKIRFTAMTQQNLGKEDGIASDTDRLFVSASVVCSI